MAFVAALPRLKASTIDMDTQAMNAWVIKARQTLQDGQSGWHWREYLSRKDDRRNWGGPDWINSALSKKLIREDIRKDDVIVCYQVDDGEYGRAILGMTRFASRGKEWPRGSGEFNCFDLVRADEAVRLNHPLTIAALRETGCAPKCFGPGTQGTLFPIDPQEFGGIIEAILADAGAQADEIVSWLRVAGWKIGIRRAAGQAAPRSRGFGSEPCSRSTVDRLLRELERRLKDRSDVFVAKQVSSLIRNDRPLIRALKEKYRFRCQFPGCNVAIPMRNGSSYCEVAHLTPVAAGGNSVRINLVVLCPNHHKMFDYGDVVIEKSTRTCIEGTLNGTRFVIRR